MYFDLASVSKGFEKFITRKSTLQFTLVLYVISTLLFVVAMYYWDFQIIMKCMMRMKY